MGFLDELKKLTRPYDEDEFGDEMEEEAVEEPPRPEVSAEKSGRTNPFAQSSYSAGTGVSPAAAAPAAPRAGKVVNLGTAQQTQVVLVNPELYESAAEIADHLREKRTVVMNLENTQKDIARRLIDFLSGVAYSLDGKIRRVANSTYIITPSSVDLVGDLEDELGSLGF